MRHFYFSTLWGLALPVCSLAQGMIVNELSNGATGSQEYIEFIVVGPGSTVDLSGFIIDDNNGDFETSATGVGIANGHFRIAPGCYTNVPVGSLILLYNANDFNAGLIPAADPNDTAPADGVYVIPHTNPCIQVCTATPTATNPSYTSPVCTYTTPTLTGGTSWAAITMANSGDAVQVRRPDGSFYHGFSYGDVCNGSDPVPCAVPNFPAEFGGGPSFNTVTGPGDARFYFFNCSNWTLDAEFSRSNIAAATPGTPGAPNTGENSIYISNISNENIDYNDLNNPLYCDVLMASDLKKWEGQVVDNQVLLQCNFSNIDVINYAEIERSADAISFYSLGELNIHPENSNYAFSDFSPLPLNYYRLKYHKNGFGASYSPIIAVNVALNNQANLLVYPNPSNGLFQLAFSKALPEDAKILVFNELGQAVASYTAAANNQFMPLDLQDLPDGHYLLQVLCNEWAYQKRLIKK